jgi:exonuclease SbcC
MIPVRLKLQGFLSYLEPVELDFTRLDVACISGANGAGKSSLLDAITWVLFGQARRRDEAMINRHADAAEVIFDFEYEGDLYRVQRGNPRGKTSLLEFFVWGGKDIWHSLTEHSIRATEERIQKTLKMDYETFTNASFFLQGRADQFAQQRPGDRKRILTSILGLEVWEGYRDRAALRRRQLEKDLAVIEGLLEEIDAEIREEPERRANLAQLEKELSQLEETRQVQQSALENQRRLQTALAEQQQFLKVLAGQRDAARQRLEQRTVSLQERTLECEDYRQQLQRTAEVTAAYQEWQAARQALAQWEQAAVNFHQHEARRAEPLLQIESQRSRLEQEHHGLAERAAQIDTLLQSLPQLEQALSQARQAVEISTEQLAVRPALEEESQRLQDAQTEAKAENKRLKDHMNELKARIDQLKEAQGADCPLCGQALPPAERDQLIQQLEADGLQAGDRYRANLALVQEGDRRFQEIRQTLQDLQTVETQLRGQQRQLDQLADRRKQIETLQTEWQQTGAERLAELNRILETGDYASEARTVLAEIDASLKELGYDAAAHDAARQVEERTRASEGAFRKLETARAALEPIERELERLKSQVVESEEDAARSEAEYAQTEAVVQKAAAEVPDIAQAERDLRLLQERENILHMQIGGAKQAVDVIKDQRRRREEQTRKREDVARQIGNLKTLERAFGKDGVPALLIEQALPEIESQANDILDRLTDGQMSVRFLTQRDYKDKKRQDKKETLDILISDAAGSREYELFSGGEAFRINFAIRLALSRVLSQRAGGRLQMLVIDEGFGSQDSEGRQRLIEVINLVREDFARILVITHLEELKDAFPARIEVEKTLRGSTLKVVT